MQEQQETRRTSIDAIELWAMRPTELVALADAPREQSGALWTIVPAPAQPDDDERIQVVDGVAIIPIEGVVMRDDDGYFWKTASLKALEDDLEWAADALGVKAVLFNVYSPGGVATGVKELADAIVSLSSIKPVAAYVDGMACSAAYWLASATGRVYAGPTATVGSIGVLRRHVSLQGALKEAGYQVSYVTAGAYKALGNSDQNLSDLARRTFQERVDQIYELFTQDVARNMGLALDQRDVWANGRDFLAAEAESLGLVSAVVGSRNEAISKLLTETHMDTNELKTTYPEQVASLQQEAVKAAVQGKEEAIASARAKAVEAVMAIAGIVCDSAAVQALQAAVASGMTAEQLQAAKQLFAAAPAKPAAQAKSPAAEARKEILDGLKAATPGAVAGDAPKKLSAEDALIEAIGNYKR